MPERKVGFAKDEASRRRNPILDDLPTSSFGKLPNQPDPAAAVPLAQPGETTVQYAPPTAPPQAAAEPALQLIGGAHGQSPLPPGVPMRADAGQLTAIEQADLQKLGWKPGDPIPQNLAEAVAAAKASVSPDGLPPPGDPATPPLVVPAQVDIGDLPPERQAELRAALAEAAEQLKRQPATATGPAIPGGPGVAAAAAGMVDREINIMDDRTEQAEQPQPRSVGQMPQLCEHCGWDQRLPDPLEPDDTEKQSFLIAVLGGKPWKKIYGYYGGSMQVTVRQLLPEEVDAIYTQSYQDRADGLHNTPSDFIEGLMRYRVALQLVSLRSEENLQVLPESYNEWCEQLFATTSREQLRQTGDVTGLRAITQRVWADALPTETILRNASTAVHRFNRLTAKLEANADTPDFWPATK